MAAVRFKAVHPPAWLTSPKTATAPSALRRRSRLAVPGAGRGRDSVERDSGGAGRAGVVDGVADVVQRDSGPSGANHLQPLRRRLGLGGVVGSDDGRKSDPRREPAERDAQFVAVAPGEDGEVIAGIEAREEAVAGQPFFARDQTVVVLAEEDAAEVALHGFVVDLAAGVAAEDLADKEVVVEAAAVLVGLNRCGFDLDPGEVADGFNDGHPVAFGHLGQHAVHVEHDERFHRVGQTSSKAAKKACVCKGVPAVTRTVPGIS